MAKMILKCSMMVDLMQCIEFTTDEIAQIKAHLATNCDWIYSEANPELSELLKKKIFANCLSTKADFDCVELINTAIIEPLLKTPTL